MREILLIEDLRRVEGWLKLPGSSKPSAGSIGLAIQAAGGRRWSGKEISRVLSTAGVPASRRAPGFGHDAGDIRLALSPTGGLTRLEADLKAAANAGVEEE